MGDMINTHALTSHPPHMTPWKLDFYVTQKRSSIGAIESQQNIWLHNNNSNNSNNNNNNAFSASWGLKFAWITFKNLVPT